MDYKIKTLIKIIQYIKEKWLYWLHQTPKRLIVAPFRKEWPKRNECPIAEQEKNREPAITHWSTRIEKHSKKDGCSGCLEEAKTELSKWLKESETKTFAKP